MRLRPIEHLENHRPKCKMHTQERQLTRFIVFYNWSTKKIEPTVFQNRTELEKSIPHIPIWDHLFLTYTADKQTNRWTEKFYRCWSTELVWVLRQLHKKTTPLPKLYATLLTVQSRTVWKSEQSSPKIAAHFRWCSFHHQSTDSRSCGRSESRLLCCCSVLHSSHTKHIQYFNNSCSMLSTSPTSR